MKRKWAIVFVTHHTDYPNAMSSPKMGMYRFWTRKGAERLARNVCASLLKVDRLHQLGICVTTAHVVKLERLP